MLSARPFQIHRARGLIGLLLLVLPALLLAETPASRDILFDQVQVFDGRSSELSAPTRVLVRGNRIVEIGSGAEAADGSESGQAQTTR